MVDEEGGGCGWEVDCGWWKDCNVDSAASWVGDARREVDMAVCGSWGVSGKGGRRGSAVGWRSFSQVCRSSCNLEELLVSRPLLYQGVRMQSGHTGQFSALNRLSGLSSKDSSGWVAVFVEVEWILSIARIRTSLWRNGGNELTLLNQSEKSDFTEKSFSSCCWISRAASLAWLSSAENEGFSPKARVPHQVRSCRIRRGSGSPLSICL